MNDEIYHLYAPQNELADTEADRAIKDRLGRVIDETYLSSADIDDLKTEISDHIANKDNPHEVTKDQLGLSNVDNTSDLDKPISTATQQALSAKEDKAKVKVLSSISGPIYFAANTMITYTANVNSNFMLVMTDSMAAGDMMMLTFSNIIKYVKFNITNLSTFSTRIIRNNVVIQGSSYTFSDFGGRKIIFIRCDGVYNEITIVEETT